MEIKKGSVWLSGFVCVEWMQMDLISYRWRVSYFCFINDMWASPMISQNRLNHPKQVAAGFLLFLYSFQVPGVAVVKLIRTAACSLFCLLGMCHFLLAIFEEMLNIVQAIRLVITAMKVWLGTWIKNFYVKAQKLNMTFAYHLEDKVALHEGGNDGNG